MNVNNNNKKIIIFIGQPGCGKGTQAAILHKKYGWDIITPGEIFRSMVSNPEEVAKQYHLEPEQVREIKEIMQRGDLVPPQIVCNIIIQAINPLERVILDGFPRSQEQYDIFMAKYEDNIVAVFDFCIEDTLLIERIKGRIYCKKCHQVSKISQEQSKFVCQACDSDEYYTRSDDNVETMSNRLKQYRLHSAVLSENYQKMSCFVRINADQPVEDIAKIIADSLKL